jgi:membrane protease YdiL (CAAX protease family)
MNENPQIGAADRKRIAVEAALIFCAFFLSGFLAQSRAFGAGVDMVSIMLSALVMAVPQILLILYILKLQNGAVFADFGLVGFSVHDPMKAFLVYLGILGVMIVTVLFLVPIILLLPDEVRESLLQGYRWGLGNAALLPLAFVFCIVSAYREELFFRAYLLTRLDQLGVRPAFAVAATAALFSAGHLYEGWIGVVVTAIHGVYLAVVFRKLRNIHSVAIAHGLYNFTVFCLSVVLAPMLPK